MDVAGHRVSVRLARALVAASFLGLVSSACIGSPEPSGEPSRTAPASSATGGPQTVWLAGLAVADEPSELTALTEEVMAAVDGAIVVSPTPCFDGVPQRFRGSSYILGVIAPTVQELEVLVAKTNRDPLFTALVGDLCVD
jgi:hypothetical protein